VSPQARKVRVADLVGSRIVDGDGRLTPSSGGTAIYVCRADRP